MNNGLKEWLSELDVYDSRWERLIDEYEQGALTLRRILQWLDAAYGKGYNDCRKEHTN